MKKLGILMAAAMIFAGTATFAATPAHTAKAATTKTATKSVNKTAISKSAAEKTATSKAAVNKTATSKAATVNAKQQEKPKTATAPHAHKAHKKHHVKKAATK